MDQRNVRGVLISHHFASFPPANLHVRIHNSPLSVKINSQILFSLSAIHLHILRAIKSRKSPADRRQLLLFGLLNRRSGIEFQNQETSFRQWLKLALMKYLALVVAHWIFSRCASTFLRWNRRPELCASMKQDQFFGKTIFWKFIKVLNLNVYENVKSINQWERGGRQAASQTKPKQWIISEQIEKFNCNLHKILLIVAVFCLGILARAQFRHCDTPTRFLCQF